MPHPNRPTLPIDAVLPELLDTLAAHPSAVLVAEPGAGKTTAVPLALLDADWRGEGRILVLEPRRLAARAAAARMAAQLGEEVGDTVGLRVRLETRVSDRTRIELITEGVFTRMILDDPELTGVAAILFDEFHERSLDGDLGLALALDVQSALREDLRLLPMSATIDAAGVARLLGDAPVVSCAGRSFPVETRYLGRETGAPLPAQMARAIRQALDNESGSILAFLPGQGEIHKVADLLAANLPAGVDLAPLYGALTASAQNAAIRPAPEGRRKVVLATAIAQTSLTIEGVRVVIDSGMARVPRYEPATGLTRLETVRVSRAAADQRRGRAGRTEPGICYRLWDEAQTRALAADDRPAILEADLSRLVLDLAAWGVTDPAMLRFADPPPTAAWSEAVSLLRSLHALDAGGALTSAGRRMMRLPLAPRLAHMLIASREEDAGGLAARTAAVLSETGLGGRSTDLRDRLAGLARGKDPRTSAARDLAERWRKQAGLPRGGAEPEAAGRVLALGYPDRVAQAQDGRGGFRMASGRGARLEESDPLAREDFLAIAEVQGTAARGRILLAAPLTRTDIGELFAEDITDEVAVTCDAEGKVRARRRRMFGKLRLSEEIEPAPDPDRVAAALSRYLKDKGAGALDWSKTQRALRARVGFLRQRLEPEAAADWPDLSDAALTETMDDWLAPYLAGRSRASEIGPDILGDALSGLLPQHRMAELERQTPTHFSAPSGSHVPIDYDREDGPTLAIRVQELFGLDRHPAIAGGRVPLILELLSPAHRPIQITRDLPGFWRGSWAQVKSEMKGRYPKHPWPDDPASAQATARAKPRGT
ncbi:ATP-dependent helicase HrpB [Stappia taiwanensis]|uniref:ATP-dependent helicase HrpB n=1 Tax=Stappia taiwanensis TaxID=992267 RepID=A0A838XR82_9HYPH|nr:ATP-dependent helicase HrpB [Stappia taiwanensis]MBA4612802.1 ATP-dependent helicase HrpB [Stappia taiwanensis]GGE89955.1 ATP-dependent helicase HrpB [Stappia taiwanensis]